MLAKKPFLLRQRNPLVVLGSQEERGDGIFFHFIGLAMCGALLAGCQSAPSEIKSSNSHFLRPTNPPMLDSIQAPQTPSAVNVPPRAASEHAEEVYTITVTDMPVRDLLFALARDANKNIDVYPGIQGRVTLSAIDQTLPQILDRVSKQVDLRYDINDQTIVVSPDRPYLKIYQVDYVNISRENTSSNKISTQLSTQVSTSSMGAEQDDKNQSETQLTTNSTNKFWSSLSRNINAILRQTSTSSEPFALADLPPVGGGLGGTGTGINNKGGGQADSTGGIGGVGNTSQPSENGIVTINPEAGMITIYATASQHERIQQYLDSALENVHRQVLIESTVVEVELSDNHQEGVDWGQVYSAAANVAASGFFSGAKFIDNVAESGIGGTILGRDPSLANYFTLTGSSIGSNVGVTATIKALETFGNTKVLSSPKIMALNNQPAVLKVVENKVFFTLETTPRSNSTTTTTTDTSTNYATFNTRIHTVPVGLIMTVTPQISVNDVVSLNVRPTISRISSWKNDPNPALQADNLQTGLKETLVNQIPEIQVKEMETMMRVHSGQVAVLGGLMQDKLDKNSNGIPSLSKMPIIGSLFGYKDDTVTKSELVVFLRPVVMSHGKPRQNSMSAIPGAQIPPLNKKEQQNSDVKSVAPAEATASAIKLPQPASEAVPEVKEVAQKNKEPAPKEKEVAPAAPKEVAPAAPKEVAPAVSKPIVSTPEKSVASAPNAAAKTEASIRPLSSETYLDFTKHSETGRQETILPATGSDRMIVLAETPKESAPASSPVETVQPQKTKETYLIDLGSYQQLENAEMILQQLSKTGFPSFRESTQLQGKTYIRVRSGPFNSREEAHQALARITDETGLQASVVSQ
ncbi:MAG: pilus (MSHA type) biogenesis protein MshL [Magnetococcus sp. DMHC-6]